MTPRSTSPANSDVQRRLGHCQLAGEGQTASGGIAPSGENLGSDNRTAGAAVGPLGSSTCERGGPRPPAPMPASQSRGGGDGLFEYCRSSVSRPRSDHHVRGVIAPPPRHLRCRRLHGPSKLRLLIAAAAGATLVASEALCQQAASVEGGNGQASRAPPRVMEWTERLGFATPDGAFSIGPTGRLHLDGAYVSGPDGDRVGPRGRASLRRARIGVEGRLFHDFEYSFRWNFAGYPDERTDLNRLSLAYVGVKPFRFIVGAFKPRFTLDDSQSSNNTLFLERAAVARAASSLAGGSGRYAAGVEVGAERFFGAAYLTGGDANVSGDERQRGAQLRLAGTPLNAGGAVLHLGVSASWVFTPYCPAGGKRSTSMRSLSCGRAWRICWIPGRCRPSANARKRGAVAAIAGRSLLTLLFAFAGAAWQLFALQTARGVAKSLRDPSINALIAEHGGKRRIATAFAWYKTATSAAGALGKALAGVLLTLTASFPQVFPAAFLLSVLPLIAVVRWLPAAAPNSAAVPGNASAPAGHDGSKETGLPAARLWPVMGLGFMLSGTANMLRSLFPILTVEYGGLTEAQTGILYLGAAAVTLLAGPAFGWLSDNVSRKLVLMTRGVANIAASAVYLLFPSFAGFTVGKAVDEAGKAAFNPAWGSLMAEISGRDRAQRGRIMGWLDASDDAGAIAGPLLAGLLWSVWGVSVLLAVRIGLALATEMYAALLFATAGRISTTRLAEAAERPP